MTYTGHVQDGAVVLDGSVLLPEGAKVTVALADDTLCGDDNAAVPSLYEQFQPLIGVAEGLPEDLAENHDHYLHGQAKR